MDRIQRCLAYLYRLDERKSLLCHSVNVNSSLSLQLTRSCPNWFMVMLRRSLDNCIIYAVTLSNEDNKEVAGEIVEALEKVGARSKCAICNQVEHDGIYCELCSLMTIRVDETCSVCLDEDRHTAVWVRTECGHTYHYECLAKVNGKCPMCRAKLNAEMKII